MKKSKSVKPTNKYKKIFVDYYKGPLKAFTIILVIAVVGQLLLGQFSITRTLSAFGLVLILSLMFGGLIQILALIHNGRIERQGRQTRDNLNKKKG